MSTEIQSAVMPSARVEIERRGERVVIRRRFDGEPLDGDWSSILSRSEFLAGVAAECNAIVIPREDLPAVEDVGRDGLDWRVTFADGSSQLFSDETAASIGDTVLGWLAIREHLDAPPPVDEAQIEALAGLIEEHDLILTESDSTRNLARRLLASGRVEVKA